MLLEVGFLQRSEDVGLDLDKVLDGRADYVSTLIFEFGDFVGQREEVLEVFLALDVVHILGLLLSFVYHCGFVLLPGKLDRHF